MNGTREIGRGSKAHVPHHTSPLPSTPGSTSPGSSPSVRLFSRGDFIRHCLRLHGDSDDQYPCPICVYSPGGDPNHKSKNFVGHLQLRHFWAYEHGGFDVPLVPFCDVEAGDTQGGWVERDSRRSVAGGFLSAASQD